jgi:aspartate aminotransferase
MGASITDAPEISVRTDRRRPAVASRGDRREDGRVSSMPHGVSPTLWINEETARRRAAGTPIVALGFGEAGLPVLPELVQRLADGAPRAEYGPVAGIGELREALAGYWRRRGVQADPDLVIAGPGSKPLLYALVHAIGGPIALPRPSWVSYGAQAALAGARVAAVAVPADEGGVPAPDRLRDAAGRARAEGAPLRAVILTLPDNPTGTVARPETVTAVCEIAQREDLLVICDEIYRDLVHDPGRPLVSPAELIPERTIVTTGLSKNLALGGWRIGAARFPAGPRGRDLHGTVLSIASEVWSAPAHPVQCAAAWAFTEPDMVRERVAVSRRLHAELARAISGVFERHGVAHRAPTAAFYLYPSFAAHADHLREAFSVTTGAQLASLLLEHRGIATLPGSAFGDGSLSVRVATSGLYGSTDEQRLRALTDPNPAALPWIARQLAVLDAALAELLGARDEPAPPHPVEGDGALSRRRQ